MGDRAAAGADHLIGAGYQKAHQQCKTDLPKLGDVAVQPSGRSDAQAVLWRQQNSLHAAERIAQVLIAPVS